METLPFRTENEAHDRWEYLTASLPENMKFVHHRGTQSFFETLIRPNEDSKLQLFDNEYAQRGEQLDEAVFMVGMEDALEACKHNFEVTHVRYDHENHVEETWENAPFRDIEGHSWHKIPANELLHIDGKWYFPDEYIAPIKL